MPVSFCAGRLLKRWDGEKKLQETKSPASEPGFLNVSIAEIGNSIDMSLAFCRRTFLAVEQFTELDAIAAILATMAVGIAQ